VIEVPAATIIFARKPPRRFAVHLFSRAYSITTVMNCERTAKLLFLSLLASLQLVGQNVKLAVASIKAVEPFGCFMRPTISPSGRWSISCASVKYLIRIAYGVQDDEILSLPQWAVSDHYAVDALFDLSGSMDAAAEKAGLQQLLSERFGLKIHREAREQKVMILRVANSGIKLKPRGESPASSISGSAGYLGGTMSLSTLATLLGTLAGERIVDQTGLSGEYGVELSWTPDAYRSGAGPGGATLAPPPPPPPPPGVHIKSGAAHIIDTNGPSLDTALREQLGLRIQASKLPLPVLVVDLVQRPLPN